MLTRRHSFYRDGSNENCRTVTRAKIVHLRKEAVPPTPRVDEFLFSSSAKKNSLFSPKSLLFSNVTSSSQNEIGFQNANCKIAKTRRRLRLNSESKMESRLNSSCEEFNRNRPSALDDSPFHIPITPEKRDTASGE